MFDMSNIQNFLTENWRIVSIGAAILSYFGWDKGKALLGKIKMPSITKSSDKSLAVASPKEIEAADVAAIARLRDRAVESKNDELLKEIKDVSAQFFDLHCDPNRVNSNKSI